MATSASSNTYVDSFNAVNHDGDTTEVMTVLGNQLTNPYLIPNMQQAYSNLGYSNISVTVTNKYVRFKPTIDQLSYLDSFMDVQGLELFDAPLDYQILLEGDYYQDPSVSDEQPTWLYAVVPTSFSFPSGIQYQLLAQIHIPGDDYTAVETEAERLASLQGGVVAAASIDGGGVSPNIASQCPDGYHWEAGSVQSCVEDNCPAGYYWNGSTCAPIPPPPSPAADAAIPAGAITVDETQQLTGLAVSSSNSSYRRAPIRKAMVVARRWFKVERTYTDDNGHFQFTKRFKHKVRINLKFKNDDAIVRSMRGVRLWQMLFPLKKTFGVFSSNKTSIDYNFQKWDNTVKAKGNRYWSGATVHNAVQEYKGYATSENIGQPQSKIRILLTNETQHGMGATPMWNKRWLNDMPKDFSTIFISNAIGGTGLPLTTLASILKHEMDVAISYNGPSGSSYNNFRSDDLKQTAYHELTHTSQYNKLGNGWYTSFVNAEVNGTIDNIFNTYYSPYGDGSKNYSGIIAVGESWAYHIGEFFADKRYGNNSSTAGQQLTTYSNSTISGLSCHLTALELYDPNLNYPFKWIPKGLYYDLIDTRNETMPVLDGVSGYTNQQFYNSFTSSIQSISNYKTNFIQQNGISPSTTVTNLFNQYHY